MSNTLLMVTPRPRLLQMPNCSERIRTLPLTLKRLRPALACMHQGQPSQYHRFTGQPSGHHGGCHQAANQTDRNISVQAAFVVIQHLRHAYTSPYMRADTFCSDTCVLIHTDPDSLPSFAEESSFAT